MSWLWAARRAFETTDTRYRLKRALLAGVRASANTQGIVTGEWVYRLAEAPESARVLEPKITSNLCDAVGKETPR